MLAQSISSLDACANLRSNFRHPGAIDVVFAGPWLEIVSEVVEGDAAVRNGALGFSSSANILNRVTPLML